MARQKEKVYQYDKNGKFIKEWESQTEVRNKYYSDAIGKYPIFRKDSKGSKITSKNISILPDETLISSERIGRIGVMEFLKRYNNPYINRSIRSGKYAKSRINVYDLDNNKIAEFKDIDIASKITGEPYNTIYNRVSTKTYANNGLRYEAITTK
jgi:hypothetical protein